MLLLTAIFAGAAVVRYPSMISSSCAVVFHIDVHCCLRLPLCRWLTAICWRCSSALPFYKHWLSRCHSHRCVVWIRPLYAGAAIMHCLSVPYAGTATVHQLLMVNTNCFSYRCVVFLTLAMVNTGNIISILSYNGCAAVFSALLHSPVRLNVV